MAGPRTLIVFLYEFLASPDLDFAGSQIGNIPPKGSCVVITVTVDTETLIHDAGYFAYSLHLSSKAFKREMGASWSRATWNILLPKREDLCFWQQMVYWKTHSWWEWQKKAICAGNDKINANRFAVNQLKGSHNLQLRSKAKACGIWS